MHGKNIPTIKQQIAEVLWRKVSFSSDFVSEADVISKRCLASACSEDTYLLLKHDDIWMAIRF